MGVPLCDPWPDLAQPRTAQPSALAGMLAADQPPQRLRQPEGTELPEKASSAPHPILGIEANVLWDLR